MLFFINKHPIYVEACANVILLFGTIEIERVPISKHYKNSSTIDWKAMKATVNDMTISHR